MTDIFESDGRLPLQYLIGMHNGQNGDSSDGEKKEGDVTNLRFYKSIFYQTEHMIEVGHWKPCSNIHS